MNDTTQTVGDPGNPLLFKMELGQEALDEALSRAGLIPSGINRSIVVSRLKAKSWEFVLSHAGAIAQEMAENN